MTEVGEAFVRVRPRTSHFKQEAEGPIAAAGRDLGKVFVAAFAIGGIAKTIESVVEAATSHQAAFAGLEESTKNAGASTRLYGQTIEELLEKEARLKGFSDEELAAGFQRLIGVTHSSKRAFDDLGKAEDLARFRHIGLAQAALAVAKQEQGVSTALQRVGIVVRPVTAAVDELKKKHAEATAAGAIFTAGQKITYAEALKTAGAVDKQASRTAGLAAIQERAGGNADKFAATASGQFARAQQDFHQFENSIGEHLLPTLASGAEGLGHLFTTLSESKGVQEEAAKTAHALSAGFHDLKVIVETIGPPLVTVTNDLGGLTTVIETLGTYLVVSKIATKLTETAIAEALIGTNAERSAAKVKLLEGSLLKLKAIGPIAVAIAISAIPSSSKGQSALDQSGVGFLGHLPIVGGFAQQVGKLANEQLRPLLGKNPLDTNVPGANAAIFAAGGVPRVPSDPDWKRLVDDGAKTALKEATHNRKLIQAGNAAIKSLREGIKTDQADLAQLKKDMADAVTQGAEAVNQAVQQAKQNLNTIGQSLASSIATYIDKPLNDEAQRLSDTQDRITARFDKLTAALQSKQQALSREQAKISAATDAKSLRQLSQSVLLPGGHKLDTDPQKALAQLEALQKVTKSPALDDFVLRFRSASLQVQQDTIGLKASAIDARRQAAETGLQLQGDALKLRQDRAAHAKQDALTQIANLTDLLNQGAISEPAFDKALAGVLKRNHLTFIAAAKADGIAYADTFAAQLKGLGLQESATKAGPQRPGAGLIPSIVRPLETLHQTEKQIASLASQERAKQLDETKKQTALLKKIAGNKAAADFTNSLTKNPGGASKQAKDLVGAPG